MDIELEKTYLLKNVPEDLEKFSSHEIFDVYLPKNVVHPFLRIRSIDGKKFEITKKAPLDDRDFSEQGEWTIKLSKGEFDALSKADGKRIKKQRYYYKLENGQSAEVDIFKDGLSGLCMVDFEFLTKEEKENFTPPNFCLLEVTQDEQLAGGILAGKTFLEIQDYLKKYEYQKIVCG